MLYTYLSWFSNLANLFCKSLIASSSAFWAVEFPVGGVIALVFKASALAAAMAAALSI